MNNGAESVKAQDRKRGDLSRSSPATQYAGIG